MEAGVEEEEEEGEERREPLHPKWDFRRIYSRLFWRPLRFYYPSTSSYNAPWSSELSPGQGSSSLLRRREANSTANFTSGREREPASVGGGSEER